MIEQTSVSGIDTDASSDAHPDFVALPTGRTVGRYKIVSVLGQGSFGITYSASDSQLDRNVALKEYLPSALAVRSDGTTVRPRSTLTAADFTWGRDRFVTEGRTIARLHDAPGIVRVFDFMEANGTAYIVMELVRGQTLDARLHEDGPLNYTVVRQILETLLSGLEQVHAAGFLHRDIKPSNILIDPWGNPTLIDFGASRAAIAGRTTAMTTVFTPGYAAVEQYTSAKQGPWTDIYGVAATLQHAITGEPPPSSFDRMLDDTRVPLVQRAPAGFPRPFLAGIDAGLAVRVVDRPQSIADWRALLEGDAGSSDHATIVLPKTRMRSLRLSSAASASSASPAKRHPLVWAGAAVAAVATLAGVGYAAFAPRSVEQVVLSEEERAEQDVRRAREQLAAAEEVVRRHVEEKARAVAEAEARQKAAAEAAERQRAEEDARRQAVVQNEQERRDAEAARQKAASDEQRRQAAEAEQARQRAVADAAERALAQEEVQKARDAVTAAEAARKQAEDEATRLKAEAGTRRQAEAAAKAQADSQQAAEAAAAAEKKTAETGETALRLSLIDRQRIQVALTSLGFDTRGADGSFGPRSRDMIAAWQKARNQPATGFLSGTQNQALLREAATSLSRFEEERKRKDDEEAKARAATAPAASTSPTPAAPQAAATPSQPNGVVDGTYAGTLSISGYREYGFDLRLTVRMANGAGTGTASSSSCGNHPISLRVDASRNVTGEMQLTAGLHCEVLGGKLSGRVVNDREIALEMSGTTTRVRGRGQLRMAQ